MKLPISWHYAYRNLTKNYRRTLLSGVGVAVGCTLAIINVGFVKGRQDLYIRSVAEVGSGHLRVSPKGWFESHDQRLRLPASEDALSTIQAQPEISVVVPRVRSQAMLSMGSRMVGAEIVGVDPTLEPRVFRFVRQMTKGRYLLPTDKKAMVIGESAADKLRIDVDDDVIVTLVDNTGAMKSDMFHIVGIVSTGSRQFDSAVCQTLIADVQELTGKPGLGELTVLLKNPLDTEIVGKRLTGLLSPENTVNTWQEMNPQAALMVSINGISARLITSVLLLVAILGVASSQLTAVLERTKEFGVLSAIGMSTTEMFKLILTESFVLSCFATLMTILMSVPILYWTTHWGIHVSSIKQLKLGEMMIDPYLYTDFGSWIFKYAISLCLVTITLASFYPSWFATRLDPATSLRKGQ